VTAVAALPRGRRSGSSARVLAVRSLVAVAALILVAAAVLAAVDLLAGPPRAVVPPIRLQSATAGDAHAAGHGGDRR